MNSRQPIREQKMKINLKLEVLKVFLLDFCWETGKKPPAATADDSEKPITVDVVTLTDQTPQGAK
jgi:hypothetical protein